MAALASAALILGLGLAPSAALADEISGVTTITKEASAQEVAPGETFTYTITVGCSSITENGCFDAQVTDLVPDEFEIVDVAVGGAASDTPAIDGQSIVVDFTEDLGGGIQGLWDSSTATITVTVRVRDDLPYEANGVPLDNHASITSSNSETKEDVATVVPVIPCSSRRMPRSPWIRPVPSPCREPRSPRRSAARTPPTRRWTPSRSRIPRIRTPHPVPSSTWASPASAP
ncbi:isopeptide-forming domain-containing fimbrial protein [Microbacterium sp. NIBRBAC000506063]|uniref:isopeptide-forming domain-containing fimbrial protein n=1 Tax=Microbacterium sp. NIBRBAC000506063 TaxID=2734618 RepID=UPI001BB4E7AE|nr:isopeptide-forming domain-containing fimbrial protein [Microbacterium sp. NIBRBAC000506063]QTV80326.1 isopeptide-forming domain-containing fimbrial protein [Microbacterium sp. NIBRBAC000506063]